MTSSNTCVRTTIGQLIDCAPGTVSMMRRPRSPASRRA
jgi:hypothetical protein